MEQETVNARETTTGLQAEIGRQALWSAGVFKTELGINDPLTHLEQYLQFGDEALISIDEDLITDIAERKLKPTFINPVRFDRINGDFISCENKFSMRKMTAITEQKFAEDKNANPQLYERARIEALEVNRLNQWYESAEINDVFIVESLPLAEERYTVVRIHQKTGPDQLTEHVITLHNATVDIFNQLHQKLGAKVNSSQTELELLDNMYNYRPGSDEFEKNYVECFDEVLKSQSLGQEFSFGLPKTDNPSGDEIENVRRQTALRSIYLDTLKTLKKSQGYVTPEVVGVSRNLGCGFYLAENDRLSVEITRELLDRSLQSVAAAFNRASIEVLEGLATSQDRSAAADFAGYYGGEARAEGIRYDGACPSSSGNQSAEAAALETGHRLNSKPSQCGNCGNCGKEYFVSKELYDKKILHCRSCKGAIHFNGDQVDRKIIDEYYGLRQAEAPIFRTESFAEYWERIGREIKLKRLKKEADLTNSA